MEGVVNGLTEGSGYVEGISDAVTGYQIWVMGNVW